jgi:hypothetical protein
VLAKTRNDRRRTVHDDGLLNLPEDIVGEKRKSAIVIQVRMGNDDVPNTQLLIESQGVRQRTGVQGNRIVE